MVGPTEAVPIDDEARWRWQGSVAARSSEDTDGAVKDLLAKLEATHQDQLILRLVAGSAACFRPFVLFADALVNRSGLPAGDREALVLRLAVELQLPYEWHSHLGPATDAGLSPTQIDALAAPELDRSALAGSQLLAVDLGLKLVDRREWTTQDWAAAEAAWGPEGALELLLAVGWWGGMVALVLGAIDLRPAAEP